MPTCLQSRRHGRAHIHAPLRAAAEGSYEELLNETLRITAEITVQQLESAARDDALPRDEFPSMEWMGEIDEASCELCSSLDGQIISRDDPQYDEEQPPVHINCRCILVGIGADEVGPDGDPIRPDWHPDPALVEEHGHFWVSEKYTPLKIPAQPEGRDFIATVYTDDTGKLRSKLTWRVEPYEIEGYEE